MEANVLWGPILSIAYSKHNILSNAHNFLFFQSLPDVQRQQHFQKPIANHKEDSKTREHYLEHNLWRSPHLLLNLKVHCSLADATRTGFWIDGVVQGVITWHSQKFVIYDILLVLSISISPEKDSDRIMWNQFCSWGSMFVVCQQLPGSLVHYFVSSKFGIILISIKQMVLINSWE